MPFVSVSEPFHRLYSSPTEPHGSVNLLGLYSNALSSERPLLAQITTNRHSPLTYIYFIVLLFKFILVSFHFLSPVSKMEVPSGKTAVSLGFHYIQKEKENTALIPTKHLFNK